MRLMISPSKNAKSFYVIQSIRRNGKNSSEIVEKLGTEKYIKETYGVEDAEAWARAYVEKLNQDEVNKIHKVLIPFATDTRIPVGKQLSFNAGYFLPTYEVIYLIAKWKHDKAGTKYPASERSFRMTINGQTFTDRGFKINVNRAEEK